MLFWVSAYTENRLVVRGLWLNFPAPILQLGSSFLSNMSWLMLRDFSNLNWCWKCDKYTQFWPSATLKTVHHTLTDSIHYQPQSRLAKLEISLNLSWSKPDQTGNNLMLTTWRTKWMSLWRWRECGTILSAYFEWWPPHDTISNSITTEHTGQLYEWSDRSTGGRKMNIFNSVGGGHWLFVWASAEGRRKLLSGK